MSREIAKRLAGVDPQNVEWKRDLSARHNRIGDILSAQGDPTAALAAYKASLKIRRRLAADKPENISRQRDLSVSQEKIGKGLRALGGLTAALSAYRASLEIRQRLAATDAGNAGWQRDLWVSFWRMAAMSEQQNAGDARMWWQKAFDVLSAMKQRGLLVSPQDEQFLTQFRAKLSN